MHDNCLTLPTATVGDAVAVADLSGHIDAEFSNGEVRCGGGGAGYVLVPEKIQQVSAN